MHEFAMTPDGNAVHLAECPIITGWQPSQNNPPEDLLSEYSGRTHFDVRPVRYLTRAQALKRNGTAILKRCAICAPDLPDPKPLTRVTRSGLGWPSSEIPGRCARGSREDIKNRPPSERKNPWQ